MAMKAWSKSKALRIFLNSLQQ